MITKPPGNITCFADDIPTQGSYCLSIRITRLCRGKKSNDTGGRYALIGYRLVTKISQVEINLQRVLSEGMEQRTIERIVIETGLRPCLI